MLQLEWKTQVIKVPKEIQVQETIYETKMVPIQVSALQQTLALVHLRHEQNDVSYKKKHAGSPGNY